MISYICAIAGRTSLGVAGVEAMDRFEMSAATLALFSSLQVGIYGISQIPVGLALDRWGPRRLLYTGAVLVAVAQLGMAVADGVPTALAARVLLGIGDATAFVSVLRLLPSWFSPFRIPLFTQLTSIIGTLGQVISAWPFMGVLHHFGWSFAFAVMGGMTFAGALLVAAFVRDTPGTLRHPSGPGEHPHEPVALTLRRVLGSPWTWLGFFTHWSGAGPAMTFTLLWGVPFLTLGMGMSAGNASSMLVLFTLINIVAGPFVGQLTAKRPGARIPMVVGSAVAVVLVWGAVLAPTRPVPAWVVVVLVVVLALAGVSSSIGFDFVRQGAVRERLGTATGATNMGGFAATLIAVEAIGTALDATSGDGVLGWQEFRLALSLQVVTWGIGLIGVLASRSRVRRRGGTAI